MMFRKLSVFTLSLSLALSCATAPEPLPTRTFASPVLPSMITDREEALEYLTLHFWDKFSDTTQLWLTDSSHVAGVEKSQMEQNFANYGNMLLNQPKDKAKLAVARMYDKIAVFEPKDTMAFMECVLMAGKYLYDANSPLRDEDLYLVFAEKMAANTNLSEVLRNVYVYDASKCALNPTGAVATDFAFSDSKGTVRTLHGIKAEHTFLFFSNPGCHSCKEIITALVNDSKVNELLAAKKLAIVNVYIDEDIAAWRDYLPNYPDTWYNGYDHNYIIRGDELYNIRAIPSIYILDKDKKVLMKDVPQERALEFIDNNL